jgi:neutral trehalase
MRLKGILSDLFILGFFMNSQMVSAGFVEKNIEKTQVVNLNQSARDKADSAWWRGERAKRQKAIDDYLKKNKKGWWFFFW